MWSGIHGGNQPEAVQGPEHALRSRRKVPLVRSTNSACPAPACQNNSPYAIGGDCPCTLPRPAGNAENNPWRS